MQQRGDFHISTVLSGLKFLSSSELEDFSLTAPLFWVGDALAVAANIELPTAIWASLSKVYSTPVWLACGAILLISAFVLGMIIVS